MMAAVPTADVVVTNPTHFAVALKYDGETPAPRSSPRARTSSRCGSARSPREHGVPVVPDPPLARSLHASVEVGQQIPEELFQAVAQVLAFVYRVAGRQARPAMTERPDTKRSSCKYTDLHRRGRRRPGRGDDDHPAAADAARPVHHAEHLGRRWRSSSRRSTCRSALDFSVVPVAAAAHDAVPPGDQRLRHAADPAPRRRRPRRRGVRRLRRRRQRRRRPRRSS